MATSPVVDYPGTPVDVIHAVVTMFISVNRSGDHGGSDDDDSCNNPYDPQPFQSDSSVLSCPFCLSGLFRIIQDLSFLAWETLEIESFSVEGKISISEFFQFRLIFNYKPHSA